MTSSVPLVVLFEAVVDDGLPARPDRSLDVYLDAAVRCVERYGWERTSVRDVAREAGVERTTVYRHVGSMDHIFRLILAREVHLLIDAVPLGVPGGQAGWEHVVELLAGAIEHALAHPVLAKVLADEPEVVAAILARGVGAIVERFVTTLSPLLAAAMDAGLVARRDPQVATEWIVRVGLSLLVTPPPSDLRSFLAAVIEPLLGTS